MNSNLDFKMLLDIYQYVQWVHNNTKHNRCTEEETIEIQPDEDQEP